MASDPIPVTILSGALGAGKTTVLNEVLVKAGDRRIAVLVNDMGEINVDAALIEEGADLAGGSEGVAELSNGCICCELRDDLETEVMRLARTRDFDILVVEASGISEPAPVARLFTTGSNAAARYRVDTTVTVVAADQFLEFFDPSAPIERAEIEDGETRPLSDLVIEQIEFGDVLLLNKCDLVSEDEVRRIERLLRAFNPSAVVHRTVHGDVDPDAILGTGRFDPTAARDATGWNRAHDHADHEPEVEHDHRTPADTYGVSSFVYRGRRPFHPQRLFDFFDRFPADIVRAKGRFWVAGRDDLVFLLGQAGRVARVEASGKWIASRPEIERDLYRDNHPEIDWHDRWGDREHGLVFIGTDVDEDSVTKALDRCLLTDAELDDDWETLDNPFPERTDGVLEIELTLQQPQ